MVRMVSLMAFSFLIQAGCSVVGVRTAEELQYNVIVEDDNFEIREYAPYISAKASTEDKSRNPNGLFRILAGYIFGNNTTDESIAMTAPVVMEEGRPAKDEEAARDTSANIAMTAPVIMDESEEGTWTMAFSMPAEYSMESLPKPLDNRVSLVEVPASTVAVIRYSGSFNDRGKRVEMKEALLFWVQEHPSYKASGKPFYAGYDPPFTVPFLRRNEVLVEVEEAR